MELKFRRTDTVIRSMELSNISSDVYDDDDSYSYGVVGHISPPLRGYDLIQA